MNKVKLHENFVDDSILGSLHLYNLIIKYMNYNSFVANLMETYMYKKTKQIKG